MLAAYAAQGLGYAVVVTSLPGFKARQHIDDTTVSLIVLGVAIAAAGGSVLANAVAVRIGSRAALSLGLLVQAVALPLIAVPTPFWLFATLFGLYGVGLGCVDAAATMQGVLVQRAEGRSLLGGFFAAYTAAAIIGALVVSTVAVSSVGAGVALIVAAAAIVSVGLSGIRLFSRDVPVAESLPAAQRSRLPRAGIWAFGLVILAAFVVDSAVSAWSTVYLQDDLAAVAWVAPLGYAAYQLSILATRLGTDRLMPLVGRRRLVLAAVGVSVLGCLIVALLPFAIAAIAGFALAGVAVGVLVPVSFGAAAELDPVRSDQVIARVNLFNYAGAILGAVGVGLLADGPGLGVAFMVPAIVLVVALLALPRFGVVRGIARGGVDRSPR